MILRKERCALGHINTDHWMLLGLPVAGFWDAAAIVVGSMALPIWLLYMRG